VSPIVHLTPTDLVACLDEHDVALIASTCSKNKETIKEENKHLVLSQHGSGSYVPKSLPTEISRELERECASCNKLMLQSKLMRCESSLRPLSIFVCCSGSIKLSCIDSELTLFVVALTQVERAKWYSTAVQRANASTGARTNPSASSLDRIKQPKQSIRHRSLSFFLLYLVNHSLLEIRNVHSSLVSRSLLFCLHSRANESNCIPWIERKNKGKNKQNDK